MSCERYRKTLAELAAGGVPPLGLEAHLAACAVCRAELLSLQEGLALADATLGEIVLHRPGPRLATRIADALAEERARAKSARPRAWRWVWATAGATALLVVAAAWQ
jgi:hypothetical protein